ncbi:MAG: hypothetical protein WC725_00670 [Patescibacteria group bacterium]|jgi:hypothetical protein
MSRTRYLLIFGITLLVMTTVIATRLYEYIIISERPTQAVVRAGYQRFRKVTDGFNFRYPIGWKYEQQISTDDYVNGFFYNQAGEDQLYLESPYSGHEFLFTYRNGNPFYSPTPTGDVAQVALVSSTILNTNDSRSPIMLSIFRPCAISSTSSPCIPIKVGGFVTGVWQRGEASPLLDINNESVNNGVFYTTLPTDSAKENIKIDQLISVLNNFRFNNFAQELNTTTTRWNVYHNTSSRYSFNYPKDFNISENVDLSYVFMATGTALNYPSSMTSGTNLSEARVLFGSVLTNYVGTNCLPEEGISTQAELVTINGINYYKSIGAGAGAGNRYDTITYATKRAGACFNITLFLHSTVLENYDEKIRPIKFDQDKIILYFNEILNTALIY